MRHDVYHYLDPAVHEVLCRLTEINRKLDLIIGELKMDVSVLVANEEKLVAAVDTLLASSAKTQTDLKTATDALAAALAANDPAATAAAQAQIDAVAKALADETAKIEPPAVTPAAPADPAVPAAV